LRRSFNASGTGPQRSGVHFSVEAQSLSLLEEQTQKYRNYVTSRAWDNKLSPFRDHVLDVTELVFSYLEYASVTSSSFIRQNYLRLAWLILFDLSRQYETFKVVEEEAESREKEVSALRGLSDELSSMLQLSRKPLTLQGNSYYAAGSFTYKGKAFRQLKPYYIVSADAFDPPYLWALLAHELGHCKASETGYVRGLYQTAEEQGLDRRIAEATNVSKTLAKAYCQYRIEQCLCDMLATRLLGRAYVLAYFAKLYPTFLERAPSPWEPLHQFRMECMVQVLHQEGLDESSQEVCRLRERSFETDWTKEEIAGLLDDMIRSVSAVHMFATRNLESTSWSTDVDDPDKMPDDVVLLYLSCWNSVCQWHPAEHSSQIRQLCENMLGKLERLSRSPDPSR
jgi:hypothetical protein